MNFRKPICSRGHDKRVVGITSQRQCKECKRELGRKYETRRVPFRFVDPICKRGHQKAIVGVRSNGACAECHRMALKRWRKRRVASNPESPTKAVYVPRLRLIRNELGLSVHQLAAETGMCVSNLYKIESGEYRARPKTMRRILGAIAPRLTERKWEELLR